MLNSYPTRSPQQSTNSNDSKMSSNIGAPEITSTPLSSPNRLRTTTNFLTPNRKLLSPRRYALSNNGTMSPMRTIKNPPGPLLTSANYNVNMSTYIDSKSPGFAGRVVQYSEENPRNQQYTHQEKYGSPGLFPIVHLFKKDLPVISPKPRKATIRIGTPEFKSQYSQEHNRLLLEGIVRNKLISKEHNLNNGQNANDVSTRSVLDALKEISRKRIHANEEYELMDDSKKKLKRDDEIFNSEEEVGDSSKRNRVDSPPTSDKSASPPMRQATKKMRTIDAILASKTSSMFANYDSGTKRKTIEQQTKISPVNKKKFSNAETQTSQTNEVQSTKETSTVINEKSEKSTSTEVKDKDELVKVEKELYTPPPKQVLKVFDDKPLEVIRKNRLGALLSALTGREIPQIPMEDRRKALNQDWPPKDTNKTQFTQPKSILSTPNKQKTPEKHVTFDLTQKPENETVEKVADKSETEKGEAQSKSDKNEQPVSTGFKVDAAKSSPVVGGFSFDLKTSAVEQVKDSEKKEVITPQIASTSTLKTPEKKTEEIRVNSTPSNILASSSATLPKLNTTPTLEKCSSTNSLGLPTSLPQTTPFSIPTSAIVSSSISTPVSSPKTVVSSPKAGFSLPESPFSLPVKSTTISSTTSDAVSKPFTFGKGPPPVFSFGKTEEGGGAPVIATSNVNFGAVSTSTKSETPPVFKLGSGTSSLNSTGNFSFNPAESSAAPPMFGTSSASSAVSSVKNSVGAAPKSIFSLTTTTQGFGVNPTTTTTTINAQTIKPNATNQGGFNFKSPSASAPVSSGFSSFAAPTNSAFGATKLNFGQTTTATTSNSLNSGATKVGATTAPNSFNLVSPSTTSTSSFGAGPANTTNTPSMFGSSTSVTSKPGLTGGGVGGGFKMGDETKPFTFGGENNNSSLPTNSMFSFKNSQSSMSFGTSTTASNTTFAPTSPQYSTNSGNGMFATTFDQKSAQQNNLFGGATSFGNSTTTAPSFGANATTAAPTFGVNTTSSGFIGSTATPSMFGSGFGASTTTPGFNSTASFGSTATTTSSGVFGTSTPSFGASSTTSSTMFGTNSFGNPTATTTASTITASFGSSNAQPPPPAFGSSFNAASSFKTATATPFGSSLNPVTTTAANSTSSPFGCATNGFGTAANSPFPGSSTKSSFGGNNNTFGGGFGSGFNAGNSTSNATPFGSGIGGSAGFGSSTPAFNFSEARKTETSSLFPTPNTGNGANNGMFGRGTGNEFGSAGATNAANNSGLFTFGSPNAQAAPSSGVFTFGSSERSKSFNFSAPNAQSPSFSSNNSATFPNSATVTPFRQPNNNSMFSIGSGASSTTQSRGRPTVRAKRRM